MMNIMELVFTFICDPMTIAMIACFAASLFFLRQRFMAPKILLTARRHAVPNPPVPAARGARNRAAPVRAPNNGAPLPNQPYVLLHFEKDYYWNIHEAGRNDELIAFQDSELPATRENKQRWLQNRILRQLIDQVENPQNGTIPNHTICGDGFVAQEKGSLTQCPIDFIRYLPTGKLQIGWPLMKRSEVDIKEEIIP